ncbi:MAG: twin-arginine translocation signal domain-containing protein [Bacteroidota bacterium]
MKKNENELTTHRRGFIGTLAAGAASIGIAALAPFKLNAAPLATNTNANSIFSTNETPDEWFDKVKGKHRIVYDVTHPEGIFPFAWPRVFLLTNMATGTPFSDCGVVVILRHSAIAYAFKNELWEKYKFGEVFKANDPATKAPATRNPFWMPKKGDFKVPGIGEVAIGINELQADGVMFCVCDAAITVYSAVVAGNMKMEAADVKKEWLSGLLPNIMVVPSGVWAVGRAQEHKCGYCFVAE